MLPLLQLQNSSLEYRSLAFLKRLFHFHLHELIFVLLSRLRKVDCLWNHWLIWKQQKFHAYLFQFQISFLFDKIEEMSVLHHTSEVCFLKHHSKSFQNKCIWGCSRVACQRLGRYFVFFLRVWRLRKSSYGVIRSLWGSITLHNTFFCWLHHLIHYNRHYSSCILQEFFGVRDFFVLFLVV